MKLRGILILAVLFALLPHVLFAEATASITQSVTVGKYSAVAFTSLPVSNYTQFNLYKCDPSYENQLTKVESASNYFSSKKQMLITNADEPIYLSIATNTSVEIKLEVKQNETGKKGLTDGSRNNIPFYIYNAEISSDFENTLVRKTFNPTTDRVYSFPLILYVEKSEVDKKISGTYSGIIELEITSQG